MVRGRRFEVGVLHDQQGRLAAELEADGGEVRRRRGGDEPGGGHRAGEADPVDPRVGHEGGAGRLAHAVDDVEDPGRDPDVERHLAEQRQAERRPLRRLDHHRVARRQGRPDLPGAEHQGGVPGDDQGRHPGRVEVDRVVGLPHDRLGVEAAGPCRRRTRCSGRPGPPPGAGCRSGGSRCRPSPPRPGPRSAPGCRAARASSRSPRPSGPRAAHAGKAARAAATAASTSAAPPFGTDPSTVPSMGEMTSIGSPPIDPFAPDQVAGRNLDAGDRGSRRARSLGPLQHRVEQGEVGRLGRHHLAQLQEAAGRAEVEALVQLVAAPEAGARRSPRRCGTRRCAPRPRRRRPRRSSGR